MSTPASTETPHEEEVLVNRDGVYAYRDRNGTYWRVGEDRDGTRWKERV
jgi:hypothetical protein